MPKWRQKRENLVYALVRDHPHLPVPKLLDLVLRKGRERYAESGDTDFLLSRKSAEVALSNLVRRHRLMLLPSPPVLRNCQGPPQWRRRPPLVVLSVDAELADWDAWLTRQAAREGAAA